MSAKLNRRAAVKLAVRAAAADATPLPARRADQPADEPDAGA